MAVTNYVWDPLNDSCLIEANSTLETIAVYAHAENEFGCLVSQLRHNEQIYYHYDRLGSTRLLTKSSQAVSNTYFYDSWGKNLSSTGTSTNSFTWLGMHGYSNDDELRYYYVRARCYYPGAALWMTLDPLRFLAGLLEYKYVLSRPTVFIDPSGMIHVTGDGNTSISGNFGIGEPCPRPRNSLLNTLHTTFLLDRGDDAAVSSVYGTSKKNRGFIQAVAIALEVTAGACSNLDCTSQSQPPCRTHEFFRRVRWTEAFSTGTSTTDGQPIGIEPSGFAAIINSCKTPINYCCEWTYKFTRSKIVTYGVKKDTGMRAYNIEDDSVVHCWDGTVHTPTLPRWQTMPADGTPISGDPNFEGGLMFPQRPALVFMRSITSYTYTHNKCTSPSTIVGSFSGYSVIAPADAYPPGAFNPGPAMPAPAR